MQGLKLERQNGTIEKNRNIEIEIKKEEDESVEKGN